MISVAALRAILRSDVLRDIASPGLFSAGAELSAINEAYRHFARETHYFVSYADVELVEGMNVYDRPERCIFIRGAEYEGRPMVPYSRNARARYDARGIPRAYSADTAAGTFRVWPTPDAAYTITLDYASTPAEVGEDDDIDLPMDYTRLLLDWAAYRLLANNDADASETIAARDFQTEWGFGVTRAKSQIMRDRAGNAPAVMARTWVVR